jgi:hypothetical protein
MEKKSKLNALMNVHAPRIQAYKYYQDMYFGNHWFTVSDENLDVVKVNHAALNVNKNVSFLMNKGFLVESDFPDIEKFLQENWRMNNGGMDKMNLFGWDMALQGGITGDAWVNVFYVEDDGEKQQYYKYDVLPSHRVFPVYDINILKGILSYGEDMKLKDEQFGFATYNHVWWGYYYKPGMRTMLFDEEPVSTDNYDYLKLPIVHCKNFPNPIDKYGLSDLVNISELNTLYDRLLTDVQDIIDYNAAPVTVIKGAKAGDLVRGANRVWSLPTKDATIDNLQLSGDLAAMNKHIEKIRASIAESSNVPEHTVGNIQAISNTSAAALAINFMPLYETMELKRITYGKALLDINRITIEMALLKGKLSASKIIKDAVRLWKAQFSAESDEVKQRFYPFSEKIDSSYNYDSLDAYYGKKIPRELFQSFITWQPPLPRDEKSIADLAIANTASNMWSRRYARAYSGISEKESILMDNEIEKQKIKEAETLKKIGATTVTNADKTKNPNPGEPIVTGLEGNPDIKGLTESKRIENTAGSGGDKLAGD